MQTTLKSPVTLSGIGLHTGLPVTIQLLPAPAGTGVIFTAGGASIPAMAEWVVDTTRGTTLGRAGIQVKTVEHCLSALAGLGVDNAQIEVQGPEMPALDGASLELSEAILRAGIGAIAGSQKERWFYAGETPFTFRVQNSIYELTASAGFRLEVELSYPDTPIGTQSAVFNGGFRPAGLQPFPRSPASREPLLGHSAHAYVEDIAKARTFCLEQEVEMLKAAGLAQGGSLANAIVVGAVIQAEGGLRYPNEFARHKLLDLLGDLRLLGPGVFAFSLKTTAPGHAANVAFVREIRRHLKKEPVP